MLETHEHLPRPDVDAARSFMDLRANAYQGKNQTSIDSAEKEMKGAVLGQAAMRELAGGVQAHN